MFGRGVGCTGVLGVRATTLAMLSKLLLGYISHYDNNRDSLGGVDAQVAFHKVASRHVSSDSLIAARADEAHRILRPTRTHPSTPTVSVSRAKREKLRTALEVVRHRLYCDAPFPGYYRCEAYIITDSLIDQIVRNAHRIMGCPQLTVAWMSGTFSGWLVPAEYSSRVVGAIVGWKAEVAVEDANEGKKRAKRAITTRNIRISDVQSTPELDHLPILPRIPSHSPLTPTISFVEPLEPNEALHTSVLVDLSPTPTPIELKQLSCTPRPLASLSLNTLVESSRPKPIVAKRVDGECSTVQLNSKKAKTGGYLSDASSPASRSATVRGTEMLVRRSLR